IVRRLEGLPLAIELAAARMDRSSPAELLARLTNRLELLRDERTGVASRQTALREAIAWSWDLLDEAERAALTQASVFRGGFGIDAAEAIVRPDGSASPTVDLIHRLRLKSLLHAYVAPETPNEVRLAMYESVREFVGETGDRALVGEASG